MSRLQILAIAALVATMLAPAPVFAQVELLFSPLDQQLGVGEGGSLSVILADTIDVRTIEMLVSYDPTVVTSLGGQAGQVYTESGCPLFPAFDENVPGDWYGGVATLGSGCYVTGPGELYRWNFEGLTDGICPVQVIGVVLYNPVAEVIADVSLAGTTIFVGNAAAVEPIPTPQLTLSLTPNPFNPSTTVRFDGPATEHLTVAVFDLTGRRVDTLWSGRLGTEPGVVRWDGKDGQGRSAPGGVYLFRIFGPGDRQATRKGILLK